MLSNAPVTPNIPVTDMDRAKEFYSTKLGLKEARMGQPENSTLFECGGGTYLYMYERPPSHAEHTLATFTVQDLATEMSELRDRGVVFNDYDMPGLKTTDGVAEVAGIKSAWFTDSEGNILALIQR